MWKHFRSGSCKALSGTDLELFLLAIQEVDRRFCVKLEEAGVLTKASAKKGKPRRKRARAAHGTLARQGPQPASGRGHVPSSNDAVLADAPLPVNTPPQMLRSAEVGHTHQASADLTYGDEDDDDDDSENDFSCLQGTFGLSGHHATTSGAENTEKPVIAASHPSPFRIKEQSPDSNALFTVPKHAPGAQATKASFEPSAMAPWPVTGASSSSLPAPVLPYATILEASGISTREDFEGLRGMIVSQADLDSFLASVYAVSHRRTEQQVVAGNLRVCPLGFPFPATHTLQDHGESLSLTTIKKFGLRQSLLKALGLA